MRIVERWLSQFHIEKRRRQRLVPICVVLSLISALCVTWNLRLTGITMVNDAFCGMDEHQHSHECPTEQKLICGFPDLVDAASSDTQPVDNTDPVITQLVCLLPEYEHQDACFADERVLVCSVEHEHGDECYEIQRNLTCTATEHTHADQCYAAAQTSADETAAASEETAAPEHIHAEGCYESAYVCGYNDHIHNLSCYADDTVDIETAAIWEASVPKQLTGQWADNLALVAKSQIGWGESGRNYILAEDGVTKLGITRYGQWYGNPYADWSAMFLNFCLNYAKVPQDAIVWSPGVYNMMRLAKEANILSLPDDKTATVGNILFLDTDHTK